MRQKLSSWLHRRSTFKDRAREEALERISSSEPYHLPDDQQKELDRIYLEATAELGE